MADAVGEDDVVAADVEQGARPEEHAGELRPDEVMALSARAVQDHDGVDHMAGRVPPRGAQGRVMHTQFREALAGAEMEIADHEVAFVGGERRRSALGLGLGGGGQAEQRCYGQGCGKQSAHSRSLRTGQGHHRWPSPTMS